MHGIRYQISCVSVALNQSTAMTMFSAYMMQWNMMYRSLGFVSDDSYWNVQSMLVATVKTLWSHWSPAWIFICLLKSNSIVIARQWLPTTASSQKWNCIANTAIANTRAAITNKCHRFSITSPVILVGLPSVRRRKRRNETIAHAMDTRDVTTEAIWISSETTKKNIRIFLYSIVPFTPLYPQTFYLFSRLSIIQYVGLCVFSLPIFLVMIEIIYILCPIIIIKSKAWTVIHCLGLRHETMVCAVCISIYLGICSWFTSGNNDKGKVSMINKSRHTKEFQWWHPKTFDASGWFRRSLSVIHYIIFGAVCFQFAHFPCDDWLSEYI